MTEAYGRLILSRVHRILTDKTFDVTGLLARIQFFFACCRLYFRYWAVVHSSRYKKTFNRKRVYWMMMGSWAWSNGVSMPTLVGWSEVR